MPRGEGGREGSRRRFSHAKRIFCSLLLAAACDGGEGRRRRRQFCFVCIYYHEMCFGCGRKRGTGVDVERRRGWRNKQGCKTQQKRPPLFPEGCVGKMRLLGWPFMAATKLQIAPSPTVVSAVPPPSVHTDFHVFSSSHPFFALTRHFFLLSRPWKAADL